MLWQRGAFFFNPVSYKSQQNIWDNKTFLVPRSYKIYFSLLNLCMWVSLKRPTNIKLMPSLSSCQSIQTVNEDVNEYLSGHLTTFLYNFTILYIKLHPERTILAVYQQPLVTHCLVVENHRIIFNRCLILVITWSRQLTFFLIPVRIIMKTHHNFFPMKCWDTFDSFTVFSIFIV